MKKLALCLIMILAVVVPVLAQDTPAVTPSGDFMSLAFSALVWSTLAVFVSQGISIAVIWMLGLPPRKLAHEIQDVQNPAVGATFFIISLIATLFVGFMTTDGFTPDPSTVESIAWIVGGVLLASIYTLVLFTISHRMMGRQANEGLYGYIRREIVLEQNAALAFFLGGLSVTPFISIVFQLL